MQQSFVVAAMVLQRLGDTVGMPCFDLPHPGPSQPNIGGKV